MGSRRKPHSVIDGDTFRLHRSLRGKRFVRLANVNAPEKGQSGYRKALNQLKGMIGGKTVTINPVAVRRRVIAEVYADGKSVNARMRERGWT